MKSKLMLTGILLLASSYAHALDVGVGVKAGTVGVGVDLSVALTQTLNARVSLTSIQVDDLEETLTIGDQGAEGDVDAVMNFDFGANALLLDWYVFDGTFHLTAGMMKNNGKIGFSGTLLDTVTVDGQVFDASDIDGNINGSISAGESYEPYVGFGWGRKADDDPGFSFSVEVGVALLSPEANLSATVNTGGNNSLDQAELDSRIQAAEDDINSELSVLEAWPIISLGVNYAF